MRFEELRLAAGFPDRESAASFCGVTVRTVRNWERGKVPPYIVKLFQLAGGDLEWVGREWRGFRFHGGRLWTDTNYPVGPGDLRAIPYLWKAVEAGKEPRGDAGRDWFLPGR